MASRNKCWRSRTSSTGVLSISAYTPAWSSPLTRTSTDHQSTAGKLPPSGKRGWADGPPVGTGTAPTTSNSHNRAELASAPAGHREPGHGADDPPVRATRRSQDDQLVAFAAAVGLIDLTTSAPSLTLALNSSLNLTGSKSNSVPPRSKCWMKTWPVA